jgi:hypothetical protein
VGASEPSFYLEYRKGVGPDAALNDPALIEAQWGLMMNWVPQLAPYSRLLDMTPSASGWSDVVLKSSQRFEDPGRGIAIQVIDASESAITFDVAISDPSCVRLVSAPSFGPTRLTLQPWREGQILFYDFSIRDEDSPACGGSDFTVEANAPSAWLQQWYTPTAFSLTPGKAAYTLILMQLPPLDPGTYQVTFTLSNLTVGTEYAVGRTVVTVPMPAPHDLSPTGVVFLDTMTLSWSRVKGATRYAVRVVDHTDSTGRLPGNDCPGNPHYLCLTTTSTKVAVPVRAGHHYTWWVHALAGDVWSEPATAEFAVFPLPPSPPHSSPPGAPAAFGGGRQ